MKIRPRDPARHDRRQAPRAQEHPTTRAEHPGKASLPGKAELQAHAGDLLAFASSAGDLGTFVTAVKAAGLADRLQGKGPFTVFAPTDAAFAKLPEGTLESLLEPANRAKLAGILGAHVVPGKLMAKDVKTMKATNVNGQDLAVKVHDGAVTVAGARVVQTDLAASNGVIHAIDTVIMPQAEAKKKPSNKPKDHPAH